MIYTVTLNPALDYVVNLDGSLLPGAMNRSSHDTIQYGGKGINVSAVLNTLGCENTALGFVAGFTGLALEQGLQEMGLRTQFLHLTKGNTRINVKVKAREETEINGTGPEITGADMQRLYAQLDTLNNGDTLVLSGSIPRGLSYNSYGAILAHLKGRQITAVVDTAGKALLEALPHRPFLIKPNLYELGQIFGALPAADSEIIDCAKRLQQLGAQNVLCSLAGDGALLLDEYGTVHRTDCPKGTVINSVGAGDSMVAGFLAGWLQTRDYSYALKLGTACGSATAFSLGLADKEAIAALLAEPV